MHADYLGGVAIDFGRLDPGEIAVMTAVCADETAHFFTTGDDNIVFISAYLGSIEDGRFVELIAGDYSLGWSASSYWVGPYPTVGGTQGSLFFFRYRTERGGPDLLRSGDP